MSGSTYIYGGNMFFMYNTSKAEYILMKKTHFMCSHTKKKSLVMGESLVGYIPRGKNEIDMMTKATSVQKM